MKSILLTTSALVAFAGAAAADGHAANDGVKFSGSASLGYNDTAAASGAAFTSYAEDSTTAVAGAARTSSKGFYWDADVKVSMSKALDNGLTAAASVGVDLATEGATVASQALSAADFALSLTSETGSLYFGDTQHAAKNVWSAVGSMDQDTFRTQDGEAVLRGEAKFGGIEAQVSTGVKTASNEADGLSVGLKAAFGSVNASLAYQKANTLAVDGNDNGLATRDEIMGVRLGTSIAGADIAVGYASNQTTSNNSTGISLSYPVGPVTLAASYVDESAGQANWDVSAEYKAGAITAKLSTDESDDYAVEGSYDLGNGMMVFAGVSDGGQDKYIGGTYALGGGASILMSYADDGDNDAGDEVGAKDYKNGTTVAVSFTF